MSESHLQPATLSRLAGAMLLAHGGEFYLIGNTKEPCDWTAVGFSKPEEGEAATLRVRRLHPLQQTPATNSPCGFVFAKDRSLEAIAELLASRLLIVRNASFSERLWRIVTGVSDESPVPAESALDVSWLLAMPDRVWEIVREAALKCI